MEGNAVEVGHYLVNRDWGCTVTYDQSNWSENKIAVTYPEKRSVRRDWIRTFW